MFSPAFLRASTLFQEALLRHGGLLSQYEAARRHAGQPDREYVAQLAGAIDLARRRVERRRRTLMVMPADVMRGTA